MAVSPSLPRGRAESGSSERTPLVSSATPEVRTENGATPHSDGGHGHDDGSSRRASYHAVEDAVPSQLSRSESQARRKQTVARRSKKSNWRSQAAYYIPLLSWWPAYDSNKLSKDFISALTMTSLVVPQSISYATSLANLPPQAGLIGAAVPAAIYSIFGTCRQLSVGPEAALSLIIGQAINTMLAQEEHAHGEMSDAKKLKLALAITSVITFEAGLISLGLGLLRLGFLDAVLSRALLRGFISAVAIVILIAQVIPMLGLHPTIVLETTLEKFTWIVEHLYQTHQLTAIVSFFALTILISSKVIKARLASQRNLYPSSPLPRRHLKILTYVPEVLVVVVLSILLSAFFRWDTQGLEVLGSIATGTVAIRLPFYHAKGYLRSCLGTSTVIAILGFLDSIVAAKDCASKFDYPISPNRELVALGACNLGASLITGTLPGYGSITRSRLAGATGATTQMTSLLVGSLVLLITFFALPLLAYLPKCILACIVCVVVFSILSETPEEVMFFWRMGANLELALMGITFALALFVSVEFSIIIGVSLSILLAIRSSSQIRVHLLGRIPGTDTYAPLVDDDEDGLGEEEIAGVLIVRIRDVALTFANAGALKERLRRLERYGSGYHHPSEEPVNVEASVVIFDLADVEDIDASACQLIREAVESYVERSVLIYWSSVHPLPNSQLTKSGVLLLSGGSTHVHATIALAIEAMNDVVVPFVEV